MAVRGTEWDRWSWALEFGVLGVRARRAGVQGAPPAQWCALCGPGREPLPASHTSLLAALTTRTRSPSLQEQPPTHTPLLHPLHHHPQVGLWMICQMVIDRNYLKAYETYMALAVGNAPWPIGVTQARDVRGVLGEGLCRVRQTRANEGGLVELRRSMRQTGWQQKWAPCCMRVATTVPVAC